MNLLLLRQDECHHDLVRLVDRRAEHLRKVLKVSVGDELRAAVIGQGGVRATVQLVNENIVELSLGEVVAWPAPVDHLVLAIPRPKALSRMVQATSSFGVASITLINAWKVDKSYLNSPRLTEARLEEDVQLGCEQGRQCHLPRARVVPRFGSFLEHEASLFSECRRKLVLDPSAPRLLSDVLIASPTTASDSVALVLGPDGGFLERELRSLEEHGYVAARLNVGPLRTEVALAATLGIRTISRAIHADPLRPSPATPPYET